MSLLAISDLHLNPNTPDLADQLLHFLAKAAQQGHEVLIAGDLFDIWLGPEHLTFPYQRPILSEVRSLVSKGLILHYVEGNRDFLLMGSYGSLFRTLDPAAISLQYAGRNIRAVHGDLINRRDTMYRFWRKATKNLFSLFLLKHLPARFLQKSSERMERDLRSTNLKHKSYFPQDQVNAFLQQCAAEGFDLVITGHFHIEREVQFQWKEKSVLFYSLPGWESGFRYLVIPQNGDRPYFTGT